MWLVLYRYEEYRSEYISTQKRAYFAAHKEEEWYAFIFCSFIFTSQGAYCFMYSFNYLFFGFKVERQVSSNKLGNSYRKVSSFDLHIWRMKEKNIWLNWSMDHNIWFGGFSLTNVTNFSVFFFFLETIILLSKLFPCLLFFFCLKDCCDSDTYISGGMSMLGLLQKSFCLIYRMEL